MGRAVGLRTAAKTGTAPMVEDVGRVCLRPRVLSSSNQQ